MDWDLADSVPWRAFILSSLLLFWCRCPPEGLWHSSDSLLCRLCIILMVPDDHFPPLWHGSAKTNLTSIEKGQGDSKGQIGSTPDLWKVSITARREDRVEAGGLLGGALTGGKPSWDTGADGIKEGEMDGSWCAQMCCQMMGREDWLGCPESWAQKGESRADSQNKGAWQPCRTPTVSSYSLIATSCPILFDPMDCSPPGSSVHGISQIRLLQWVAIPFSRGSSWSRDRTWASCIGRWVLYWLRQQGSLILWLLKVISLLSEYRFR